jgi:hypothetical protein
MAVSEVSPADQDAVRTALKRSQDMMRRYGTRTHHPDYPDVRRITQPADPGQIGGTVCTPVAQKGNDPGLKILFIHFFSSKGKFNFSQRR